MALYRIENLTFTYPSATHPAISELNCEIKQGDFVLVCGASGSGKTTFLKHLNKHIAPLGQRTGQVLYKEQDLFAVDALVAVQEVAMVLQDPESQLVMDRVISEICFSLENIGLKPALIKQRLAEIVTYFGLEKLLYKPIAELSGGQKQMINLCAVLVLQPQVLIFDEPTSQLDPIATKELIHMIQELNAELNITVIMSAHKLDHVIHLADQIIFMEQGKIIFHDTPQNFCRYFLTRQKTAGYQYVPYLTRLANLEQAAAARVALPLTVRESRRFVKQYFSSQTLAKAPHFAVTNPKQERAKELPFYTGKGITFAYQAKAEPVLKHIDLEVYQNDFIAILGANGSGKSTLLKVMAGLLKPQLGHLRLHTKKISKIPAAVWYQTIGYVAQNPLLHFTQDSVEAELNLAGGQPWQENEWLVQLVERFELKGIVKQHPYDCSGGQQQKIAIVMALAHQPQLLFLDEPTKGLDPISKNKLAALLCFLAQSHTTVVCVTHDIDFAASYCQRVWMMFDKEIIYDGPVREYLTNNNYFTTQINRVMKLTKPKCMSIKDVEQWQDCLKRH